MGTDQNSEQAKPKIALDPSKFTIGDDGQVVVNDPSFTEALRSAVTDEGSEDGHGISVGVVVGT